MLNKLDQEYTELVLDDLNEQTLNENLESSLLENIKYLLIRENFISSKNHFKFLIVYGSVIPDFKNGFYEGKFLIQQLNTSRSIAYGDFSTTIKLLDNETVEILDMIVGLYPKDLYYGIHHLSKINFHIPFQNW